MTRIDFMNQLEKLLQDISESERAEAMDYYNSYFDDAGQENESKVIQELGSPGKVAAIIKADLAGESGEYAEYTENGYQDRREGSQAMPDVYQQTGEGNRYQYRGRAGRGYQPPVKKNNTGNLVLIILILVVSSVVWLPVLIGLFGVLIGIVATIFAVFVTLVAAGLSGLVAGAFILVKGIIMCFTNPGLGLLEMSAGLLSVALGVLCVWFIVLIVTRFCPWLIRCVTDLCNRLLNKRKQKKGADV